MNNTGGMEEQIEKNLTKSKNLLVEWENSHSLEEYISIYEKLSMYSVFLSENLSDLKKLYNRSYYSRKIAVSHSFLSNRSEKIAETTSLKQAEEENKELIKQELEAEALMFRLQNFLQQTNKVLDCMRTIISFERGEKDRITKNDL